MRGPSAPRRSARPAPWVLALLGALLLWSGLEAALHLHEGSAASDGCAVCQVAHARGVTPEVATLAAPPAPARATAPAPSGTAPLEADLLTGSPRAPPGA